MKVSVDLFRILRLVTYFKVPFPREKWSSLHKKPTMKATLSNSPLDPS